MDTPVEVSEIGAGRWSDRWRTLLGFMKLVEPALRRLIGMSGSAHVLGRQQSPVETKPGGENPADPNGSRSAQTQGSADKGESTGKEVSASDPGVRPPETKQPPANEPTGRSSRNAECQLLLGEREHAELKTLANGSGTEFRLVQRARIILAAAEGIGNTAIAGRVRTTPLTARKWVQRYPQRRRERPDDPVAEWLADAGRVGRPDTFDEFFWIDLMALATSNPEQCGRPITHWTSQELADEMMTHRPGLTIHRATVSRFLREVDLKPHRVQEWMNRKQDPQFEARATDIKDCLVQATTTTEPCPERVVCSFDEKTGMQAKERIAADQPIKPGRPVRREFEYARHGTLVLFALMVIHTGQLLACTRPDRTNPVTAEVLLKLFRQLFDRGAKRIDLILDQLNTHWSCELVRGIAALCGLPIPSDAEIEHGEQRRTWLSDPGKAIVFHFTPKHASWLNPVEIWFGVLARKVLRRGSFRSTEDLAERVQRFIDYYNIKLAHPYAFKRWRAAA